MRLSKRLLNPHGVLHGGVIYSMADTGMGAALYTRMEEEELCASIQVDIYYFAAVSSGTLTCESKLVRRSKKIAVLESEVKNRDNLVAKAVGTFYIFNKAA